MKFIQLLIIVLLLGVVSHAQRVVHVFDGDTYRILDENGKLQIMRLANVDCPELDQYYGKLVKASVSKLILGKQVSIEPLGEDLYQRTIAQIKIGDVSLDSLLVAKGYAWHFPSYHASPHLHSCETKAKRQGLGMWRCKRNVEPWLWRRMNKKEKRLKEMCRRNISIA